jgi:hypothetical protein
MFYVQLCKYLTISLSTIVHINSSLVNTIRLESLGGLVVRHYAANRKVEGTIPDEVIF